MRVYFEPGFPSWGISRVAYQLSEHLPPDFTPVGDPGSADLVVLHVVGRRDHNINRAGQVTSAGAQYAVIQYVLGSCRNPDPADWKEFWDGAKVVWSYYDLPTPKLYRAPLAADPTVFYKMGAEKKYLVGTNGNTYRGEAVGEVHMAAYQAGGKIVHVGEKFNSDPIVTYLQSITDDELRDVYNGCDWWSSLRRWDGFEMTAVEALLCGVRPIMFDTPNYRHWFDGLAKFIPECHPGEMTGRLKRIFKDGVAPVIEQEIEETKTRFDWRRSVTGFWERCLNSV
jgi:hypothetical protein